MKKEQELLIIKQIQNGNNKAENDLFLHFDERIKRKVRFTIGTTNEDWEDIVSEVKIALLHSIRDGKFDFERGVSLGSYVYGITMNKIRDYFKHKKDHVYLSDTRSDSIHLSINDENFIEQKEMKKIIRHFLARLKLKYKEVLYLRYYEELSISQISQKIDLPPRRVSERINYAIKLLRKECIKEKIFFNILGNYAN